MCPLAFSNKSNLSDEDFPKEMNREQFDNLLEKIDEEYPVDQYPDLYIIYDNLGPDCILVLGIGTKRDVARQLKNAIATNPQLKKHDWEIEILRQNSQVLIL